MVCLFVPDMVFSTYMKKKSAFQDFYNSLSDEDRTSVDLFLKQYDDHLDIERSYRNLLLDDARNALAILVGRGQDLKEALSRLSPRNLGGFYAHEALAWYPLDDAAKIYPLSMKFGQMPMFRLSCYLKEDVIPEILQIALDFTIKRFPSFATVVRKGFFWHYLDSIKRRFAITEDNGMPCQGIRIGSIGVQSFRVLHYGNRISCEFFHVLADGSGGMVFLKSLVTEYLHLLGAPMPGAKELAESAIAEINAPASASEVSNDFERFFQKERKNGGFSGPAALQMSGRISHSFPCKVIHLTYNTQELLDLAHSYKVSLTSLMLGLMFMSHRSATELSDGKVQIQVPVNMRKFFSSDTVRNFSMYCSIDMAIPEIGDLEQTSREASRQLAAKATYDEMTTMMATARRLVKGLRAVPLAVKSPFAKIIYGFLGDSRFSNTLSNLGTVKMPEGLEPYIQGFDFVLGTCVVSRASCSMVSYNGNTVLSISKNTRDPSFEERLCALSKELGLEPAIMETPLYD